jgi:hypothetical protein
MLSSNNRGDNFLHNYELSTEDGSAAELFAFGAPREQTPSTDFAAS